jgi:hypothetical protein
MSMHVACECCKLIITYKICEPNTIISLYRNCFSVLTRPFDHVEDMEPFNLLFSLMLFSKESSEVLYFPVYKTFSS